MLTYTLDLQSAAKLLDKYWEFCVGSCHAATALREDYRNMLRQCRHDLGFRYIRFTKLREGIYNDTMPLDLQGETDALAEEHILLWNSRNKPYGCAQGLAPLRQMQKQAEELCSGRHTQ